MEMIVETLPLGFLDYFVGLAEGENVKVLFSSGSPFCYSFPDEDYSYKQLYQPTSDGRIACEIIERERILCTPCYKQNGEFVYWEAKSLKWELTQTGSTQIIAAMRSYVVHKFGEIVSI